MPVPPLIYDLGVKALVNKYTCRRRPAAGAEIWKDSVHGQGCGSVAASYGRWFARAKKQAYDSNIARSEWKVKGEDVNVWIPRHAGAAILKKTSTALGSNRVPALDLM